MQLTKIVLKNYGVYRDKVEFDLTTTDEKPVILIGGTNGAGKTTLFESILLGFYGQSYFDKKTTRKTYEKFLSNKIHRFLGTATSADSTSIIIDFNRIILVNPIINSGDGDILEVTAQINSGIQSEVIISVLSYYAETEEGNEIGIISNNDGVFNITELEQLFSIQNGSGTINGGTSFSVFFANSKTSAQLFLYSIGSIFPIL